MGALEDYYKRNHDEAQQRLIDQQNAARAQGLDPALAGQQPSTAPATSPLGVAAGAPAPETIDPRYAGASGSYIPTSTGSVDPGHPNAFQTVFGQDQTVVTPALQGMLPDKGDVPAVNAAMADYDARHKTWVNDILGALDHLKHTSGLDDLLKTKDRIDYLKKSEPGKPDLGAIQHQSDRDRLLTTIGGTYEPLIAQLQESAAGRGPSAAMSTYRAAADDASNRNYGIAASSKGTGGQRAALFQAALGQNAQDAQGAARQSAIIAAQEQNQGRAALNSALQGLTNVYGTTNLLGDTSHQQDKNQDAYNEAIGINAKIQSDNAARASAHTDAAVSTGAKIAGGI